MANRFKGTLEVIPCRHELIEGSETDYIGTDGIVYKLKEDGLFFPKKNLVNRHNGYVYCRPTYIEGNKNRRLHVLLAKAFIPNPENLPVVGHWDNNKENCSLENLYWTTVQENTQKAFDDGLLVNDKGIEDSQAKHIACYRNSGELVSVYGSQREAVRLISGAKLSTIVNSIRRNEPYGRKGYYYTAITLEEYEQLEPKKLVFEL